MWFPILLYRICYSTIIRSSNIFFNCNHIMHKSILTFGLLLTSLVMLSAIPLLNNNNSIFISNTFFPFWSFFFYFNWNLRLLGLFFCLLFLIRYTLRGNIIPYCYIFCDTKNSNDFNIIITVIIPNSSNNFYSFTARRIWSK